MQKKDTEQILLYYGKIEKQLDSVNMELAELQDRYSPIKVEKILRGNDGAVRHHLPHSGPVELHVLHGVVLCDHAAVDSLFVHHLPHFNRRHRFSHVLHPFCFARLFHALTSAAVSAVICSMKCHPRGSATRSMNIRRRCM